MSVSGSLNPKCVREIQSLKEQAKAYSDQLKLKGSIPLG